MKNLITLCFLSILIISCKKDNTMTKNPKDYLREDFIGSYDFKYSRHVITNSQGGVQLSDTTYFGERTIRIELPSANNACPISENRIALKNLKGNNNYYCAKIVNNTFEIDESNAEGRGTLIDNKLTLNIDTPFGGISKDDTKGTATKN